jgi:membrane-associated protease RseP (regulator of RpoE activity)
VSAPDFPEAIGLPETQRGDEGRGLKPAPALLPRFWLHGLLLAATLFTASLVGARMQQNFERNLPFFDIERDVDVFTRWIRQPSMLIQGLPFALTLLGILLAHEMGHYLACRFYGVNASLPYFLPAPTFTGTLGAFIRIRAPIYSRRVLFDIGIAGPLAGFAILVPALAIGLAYSKVIPGIGHQGSIAFGTPALLWLLNAVIFPGTPGSDIYLHPVARAAWMGILATALNLLPIGQLDGGHIIYSLASEKHKLVSRLFIAVLVPLGFLWWVWWLWAVLLLFFGMRHPAIYDFSELGPGRRKLGALALAVFVLCFTFTPVAAINSF